jgi:hypothetical protein
VGAEQGQFFKTSNDLPQFIEDRLSDETTYCRLKYAHGNNGDKTHNPND